MLTTIGVGLILNLFYFAFALVALYVVMRLAVTHALAADRRRPASSQLRGSAQ